ncbi:unnamed protein product [Soboliphyme baturini]|uniref:Integrase n=1 Tax=Soboliphyme baturini TaxID=241478 RepID=A0A183J379_9BILA|nr:unnamed protein product [Soboliphyme baturini]
MVATKGSVGDVVQRERSVDNENVQPGAMPMKNANDENSRLTTAPVSNGFMPGRTAGWSADFLTIEKFRILCRYDVSKRGTG